MSVILVVFTPASGNNPGNIDIWNAISGVSCTVNYGTGAQVYLSGTRNDYDVLTVQDTSIITNKTVTVGTQTAAAHTADLKATVVLSMLLIVLNTKLK